MNKKELNQRVNELIKSLIPELKEECKRLINSGALDFSKDDSRTYRAAKIVLTAAMSNKAFQPFDDKWKSDLKNLSHF